MKDHCGRTIDYMRVSVTERCNLRCRYCMPEEGICKKQHHEMMTHEEILNAVKAGVTLGISKIRITGGEPLVRKGILSLCRDISAMEGVKDLCMTTNGTLLGDFAKDLKAAGVSRLNISLDTLDAAKYRQITRCGNLKDALTGIHAAFEAGFDKIKINTVLMGGFNDDEIRDFIDLTRKLPVDVRFIEMMPMGDCLEFGKAQMSCDSVLFKAPELQYAGMYDGVSMIYQIPGAKGRIGLIRTISCAFCDNCNKIRLTADGMIKPCLHLGSEFSIKGKPEKEMIEIIKYAILHKPERRQRLDVNCPSKAGRNMNCIGG